MKLDRPRGILIVVSILPFLIGSIMGFTILGNPLFNEVFSDPARSYTLAELVIQALISTCLGSAIVLSLFWILERRSSRGRRMMVAFIVSPILSLVFFVLGQSLLLILFKGTSNAILPSLISLGSLAVFMFSIVFILIDAIPPLMRNLFAAFYGSIFGTFLGVAFVTSSMIVLILSIVVEDYLLIRFSPAAKASQLSERVGSDPFDYTRIQSESIAVGAGDFVAFSMISTHALLYFPLYVWVASMALAVIGVIINVTMVLREHEPLPGIPIPALLAIYPWLIHVIAILSSVA
ncbi:MAG: hypothetical protein ACXABV_17220 [Candidatus Thorarchaeota archaeon]|jgi:hypothetical protein